jgi:hypothetical protein
MELKVNINDAVKVKLTDFGVSILKEKREKLNKAIKGRGGKGFGEFELKKDADGYTTFQHWELMNTFGDVMTMGFNAPFETDIIVTKGKPITA